MAISDNIKEIQKRINKVCERVGRNPEEIEIVAVSKNVEVEKIRTAVACGIHHIGENRVQEAWVKFNQLGKIARWHMVGHLQTNKVQRALQFFDVIQSVDSLHLVHEISKRAVRLNKQLPILVEVNTSGEVTKFGIRPEETLAFLEHISRLPGITIEGLMTIGTFSPDPEEVRPCFQMLRELRDAVLQKHIPGVKMKHLSMGMTDDFEVAIEEGSTMVRIGRAIFGERT